MPKTKVELSEFEKADLIRKREEFVLKQAGLEEAPEPLKRAYINASWVKRKRFLKKMNKQILSGYAPVYNEAGSVIPGLMKPIFRSPKDLEQYTDRFIEINLGL